MKAAESCLSRPSCRHCGRVFNNYRSLERHCKVLHALTDYEMNCSLCGVNLFSRRDYYAHALSAHSQTVLNTQDMKAVCGLCGCSVISIDLWGHIRIVHLHLSDLSTECLVCAQVVGKKDLKTHYTEEHPSVPCHRCTQVFGSLHAYISHFSRSHTNSEKAVKKESTKAIVCGLCGVSFALPYLLNRHIFSTHLQLVPKHSTVCLYCCQVLPRTDFTSHLNSLHSTFQCLLCTRDFSKNGYGIHLKSHFSS